MRQQEYLVRESNKKSRKFKIGLSAAFGVSVAIATKSLATGISVGFMSGLVLLLWHYLEIIRTRKK